MQPMVFLCAGSINLTLTGLASGGGRSEGFLGWHTTQHTLSDFYGLGCSLSFPFCISTSPKCEPTRGSPQTEGVGAAYRQSEKTDRQTSRASSISNYLQQSGLKGEERGWRAARVREVDESAHIHSTNMKLSYLCQARGQAPGRCFLSLNGRPAIRYISCAHLPCVKTTLWSDSPKATFFLRYKYLTWFL